MIRNDDAAMNLYFEVCIAVTVLGWLCRCGNDIYSLQSVIGFIWHEWMGPEAYILPWQQYNFFYTEYRQRT